MKTNLFKSIMTGIFLIALSACAVFKNNPPEYAIDLVCNMKVQKTEAYTYKYQDKKYYFDSYTCKESFKMNPEKFIQNKCTDQK